MTDEEFIESIVKSIYNQVSGAKPTLEQAIREENECHGVSGSALNGGVVIEGAKTPPEAFFNHCIRI